MFFSLPVLSQNVMAVHTPTLEAPAPSITMVHPVAGNVLGHGALGGTAAPVLEVDPGPPAGGLVVVHPHTGGGLALLPDSGQGHLVTAVAVVGARLCVVLVESAPVGVLLANRDQTAVRDWLKNFLSPQVR